MILLSDVPFPYHLLVISNQATFLMKNTINYLRTHRKNTNITQYDIAVLLKLRDNSIVSRCEKGHRSPSLEMVLVYHLLFDIPIHALFPNHIGIVKEQLRAGIPLLIAQIEEQDSSAKAQSRISFLHEALTRLVQSESHEE